MNRVRPPLSVLALLGVVLSLGAAACNDPVHDQQVAALGGEAPGVPKGELHRPGQPCLVCHGGSGPANLEFSVAGTIYTLPGPDEPGALKATVTIQDVTGAYRDVVTNSAGNFFILPAQWTPTYPIIVPALVDSSKMQDNFAIMTSLDNRDGSCASCHTLTPGPTSVGPIYLYSQ